MQDISSSASFIFNQSFRRRFKRKPIMNLRNFLVFLFFGVQQEKTLVYVAVFRIVTLGKTSTITTDENILSKNKNLQSPLSISRGWVTLIWIRNQFSFEIQYVISFVCCSANMFTDKRLIIYSPLFTLLDFLQLFR